MSGSRVTLLRAVTAIAAALTLCAGCATFTEQPPQSRWQNPPSLSPEAGPAPDLPEAPGGPSGAAVPPQSGGPIQPPDGCVDYHPAVIATCLDQVFAVAALPSDPNNPAALIGERRTGRILKVQKDMPPVLVARLAVDASTDGGLTGLALSPSYDEDQLIFAYITTRTDNRLVRIAAGDTPKVVLSGIPRGASGNRGALAQDHHGALLLATGDAGSASAATDPGSLAGKVLRVDASGKPADGNPTAGSAVVAGGLHAPGGVCAAADGGTAWVTDRAPQRDELYRIVPGKTLGSPAWSWPDRPGVAGCIAWQGAVSVVTSTAGNLQNLPLAPDGSFTGKPTVTLTGKDGFGRLGGADLIGDSAAVAGTVNKLGGTKVSSDDRAIVLTQQGNTNGGTD